MRNSIMQIMALGIIITFSIQKSYAQIFQSRTDIIKENGYLFESDTTDDGTKYLYYEKEYTSDKSGKYTRQTIFYFTTLDDGTEICKFYKIIEPSSETNPWVIYFKKNMVEVDYMKWKDYESGVIYKLDVEDGLCIVLVWYDFDKR